MSLTTSSWQRVPRSRSLEVFPILAKPSIVSSNCLVVSAPAAILVVDPGANPEQTKQISEVVTAALAASERPVLLFLTHCHQDHSQEADRLALPPGTECRRFAHESAARALESGDRALTVAYLYPWHPDVCRAPIHGRLFSSDETVEARDLAFSRIEMELAGANGPLPDGLLARRSMPLGDGERLDIFHTPGHTACSLSLRVGSMLMVGDLPFAANPGLCGLDGWNHQDLISTLHGVDHLLESGNIDICCAGHGYAIPAAKMRQQLRLMREEARDLTAVDMMNANRIAGLKQYTDELLEEASMLFTALSGRIYTAAFYLFDGDVASEHVPAAIDLDAIDRTLTEFRRFADAFNNSAVPELTVVLKGVQAARSLQKSLAHPDVERLLDPSLVGRAQRRLADFLSVVRGLQFLSAESPASVNGVLEHLVARLSPQADLDAAELVALAHDQRSFLDVLTRRLTAHSPLSRVTLGLEMTSQRSDAAIAAERLDDIVTSLIEAMAAAGATRIQLSSEATAGHVVVRMSADTALPADAIGPRRLALYARTLGWLGGSLEREYGATSTFRLRLPAIDAALVGM